MPSKVGVLGEADLIKLKEIKLTADSKSKPIPEEFGELDQEELEASPEGNAVVLEEFSKLREANIKEIIATDTIPIPEHKQLDNLTILSTANLLAEVIKRNIEHTSISTLFN